MTSVTSPRQARDIPATRHGGSPRLPGVLSRTSQRLSTCDIYRFFGIHSARFEFVNTNFASLSAIFSLACSDVRKSFCRVVECSFPNSIRTTQTGLNGLVADLLLYSETSPCLPRFMIHVCDFPVTGRRLPRNFPVTRVTGNFRRSRRNGTLGFSNHSESVATSS